jgi:hypothetical protein
MKCALYRVVHRDSGRDYVGVSSQPEVRWVQHQRSARAGSRTRFHRALHKYGLEAFDWKVIAWASCFKGAATLEKMARHLGMGLFNMTSGGEGVPGLVWSQESREKQSRSKTGTRWSWTPEARARWKGNRSMLGRKHSPETKRKISEALKARKK